MKELAQKYPWIDIDRAGMYGHSGGGNATAAAMFHFPDFFKVGIAESGNHDQRDYEDDWAEKWAGLEVKSADGTSNYDSQANQNYVKNLKGHLLLAHGTMDDNVPLNNTPTLVEALIKANKDFDLLLIPNAHHGYGSATPYMTRRRWDYFVRNLAGEIPPQEYEMKPWKEEQSILNRTGYRVVLVELEADRPSPAQSDTFYSPESCDPAMPYSSLSNRWIAASDHACEDFRQVSPFSSRKFGKFMRQYPARSPEVVEPLRNPIQVQHGLHPITRPLHRGNPLRLRPLVLGVALGQRLHVIDQHGVQNAVFVRRLGAVAGIKIGGDSFIFKYDRPRRCR